MRIAFITMILDDFREMSLGMFVEMIFSFESPWADLACIWPLQFHLFCQKRLDLDFSINQGFKAFKLFVAYTQAIGICIQCKFVFSFTSKIVGFMLPYFVNCSFMKSLEIACHIQAFMAQIANILSGWMSLILKIHEKDNFFRRNVFEDRKKKCILKAV